MSQSTPSPDPRSAWRGRRALAPTRGLHPSQVETGPPPIKRRNRPAPDPDAPGETLLPEDVDFEWPEP